MSGPVVITDRPAIRKAIDGVCLRSLREMVGEDLPAWVVYNALPAEIALAKLATRPVSYDIYSGADEARSPDPVRKFRLSALPAPRSRE